MRAGFLLNRSKQAPAEDSAAFGGVAERFRRAGELDRAIALCREGLRKFPTMLSARVTLGWALLDQGHYNDARLELEHVLRRAPDNLAAIRGLAELHDRTEQSPGMDGQVNWHQEESPDAVVQLEAGSEAAAFGVLSEPAAIPVALASSGLTEEPAAPESPVAFTPRLVPSDDQTLVVAQTFEELLGLTQPSSVDEFSVEAPTAQAESVAAPELLTPAAHAMQAPTMFEVEATTSAEPMRAGHDPQPLTDMRPDAVVDEWEEAEAAVPAPLANELVTLPDFEEIRLDELASVFGGSADEGWVPAGGDAPAESLFRTAEPFRAAAPAVPFDAAPAIMADSAVVADDGVLELAPTVATSLDRGGDGDAIHDRVSIPTPDVLPALEFAGSTPAIPVLSVRTGQEGPVSPPLGEVLPMAPRSVERRASLVPLERLLRKVEGRRLELLIGSVA